MASGQVNNVPSNPNYDPSYGGVFATPPPSVHPDEYIQPENKQDQFDWKLSQVSVNELTNAKLTVEQLPDSLQGTQKQECHFVTVVGEDSPHAACRSGRRHCRVKNKKGK